MPIVASSLNSCAATRPASPRGSVANKAGAATKPTPAISPAHVPASQLAARRRAGLTRSLVADAGDLVALDAAGCLHLGDVALDLADQRARDRRADRDQPLLEVGFVVADDLVGDLGAAVFVLEVHRRAEDDPAVGVDRLRVDDLRRGQLALELE